VLVAYPFSEGPLFYFQMRGWLPLLPARTSRFLYAPANWLRTSGPEPLRGFLHSYHGWWVDEARDHYLKQPRIIQCRY
jgi:hypothetical protein